MTPRAFLEDLFNTAVAAAHPAMCLPPHLPAPPANGRLILLAAGKAAGSMIEAAERHYLDELKFPAARLTGIAVARHGYGRPTRVVPMVEAGHPIPDAAGLESAARALKLAESAGTDDLVLALMSGGASANWIAPAGITFGEKRAVTRALLRSGAGIGEINTVRKHLSAIKGGRLARAAYPARVVTLAISDVPGDDPAVIGSGPTVPDPSTLADARLIVARYQLDVPEAVTRALNDPANESPKPGDPAFANTRVQADRAPGGFVPRRRGGGAGRRLRMRVSRRECRRRGARGGRRAGPHGARTASRRPPRRDPLGRRADRDDPRQGPRRAEPGIRAGARHRTRRSAIRRRARCRHGRHRRRSRFGGGPGRRLRGPRDRPAGAGTSPSIRPRFLPTTIRRASSSAWATWYARVPPSRTSMTSAPSSLTLDGTGAKSLGG